MAETFDLKAFAQSLFDAMTGSANMGITPPMTFAVRENGQTHIETLPENCGFMLSIGSAKDHIFQFWRNRCAKSAVDAFACGSEAWGYEENEVGTAFREKNQSWHKKLIDHGFVTLTGLGHGTRYEMFSVTAQTRDRVLFMSRRFVRKQHDVIWTHEAESGETTQSRFKGRQKMWGDLRPENLS